MVDLVLEVKGEPTCCKALYGGSIGLEAVLMWFMESC